MQAVKTFFAIYIIVVAAMYFLYSRSRKKGGFLPGDLYVSKGPRTIYVPLLSAFLVTIVLFAILMMLTR